MTDTARRWAPILGRILLGFIFLKSGYGKITDWHGTEQYMAAKGFPLVDFFILGAIILEIGGAVLLMTGLCPKLGATMLILFLIPTTFIFHNFWALEDAERQMQMGNFIKNLAVMGGLLLAASMDWTKQRRGQPRISEPQ